MYPTINAARVIATLRHVSSLDFNRTISASFTFIIDDDSLTYDAKDSLDFAASTCACVKSCVSVTCLPDSLANVASNPLIDVDACVNACACAPDSRSSVDSSTSEIG